MAAGSASEHRWWLCPNGQCDHGSILHDIEDYDDPRPTCCAEGCPCGHEREADTSLLAEQGGEG